MGCIMNIENEIFKKCKVDYKKLIDYGFILDNDEYILIKNIMNNNFKAVIKINEKGNIIGKIYDKTFDDIEYTTFRIENNIGSFANKVKSEYINLLEDIKDECFINTPFIYPQTNRIAKLIKDKYGDSPLFEWERTPGCAAFKNKDTLKWYGIIMDIDRSKLEDKNGLVEIIDIKLNPDKIIKLLNKKGFYPAYHMNKKSWITIILDDTLKDDEIMEYIDESYNYSKDNKDKVWVVPANPTYYDICNEFDNNDIVLWKQSTNINVGNIVYMYVTSPIKALMYKTKVLEVNIPYNYKDSNVCMKYAMKLEVLERYKDKYPFELIKKYGLTAIRGPRYITKELFDYLNK